MLLKCETEQTCFKDLMGCFGLSPFIIVASAELFLSGLLSILTAGLVGKGVRMVSSPSMMILVSLLQEQKPLRSHVTLTNPCVAWTDEHVLFRFVLLVDVEGLELLVEGLKQAGARIRRKKSQGESYGA